MEFLRKYNTATEIYIPMVKRGVVDHAVGADWTPAAGDVMVSIDGAAFANIGTLPVAVAATRGASWKFVMTGGETTGKRVYVEISDAATKAVEDNAFELITYGNASAEIVQDISASVAQTGDSYARIGANGVSLSAIPDMAGLTTLLARLTAARAGYLDSLNGNVAQSGDSYARIGAAGVSLSAIPDLAGVTTLLARLTAARAGYIDSLNGNVAQSGDSFARIGANGVSLSAIPDLAGLTTLLSRLSAGRATNLDNLDAAISTVGAIVGAATLAAKHGGYTFKQAIGLVLMDIIGDSTGAGTASGTLKDRLGGTAVAFDQDASGNVTVTGVTP